MEKVRKGTRHMCMPGLFSWTNNIVCNNKFDINQANKKILST